MRLLLLSLGLGAMHDFVPPPAKIGFIATAGEPYPDPYFVNDDRTRLKKLEYEVVEVDITNGAKTAVSAQLRSVDAIFVAGGNTFYLLQQIQKKGLVAELTDLLKSGKRYIGASAGAVIVGPTIAPVQAFDDPKEAPELVSMDGLNVVDFVVLPHFGKEKYLEKYRMVESEYKGVVKTVRLKDNEGLLVSDADDYVVVESALVLHEVG